MKVHEYQAKEVLARYGVPVPRGRVAGEIIGMRLVTHQTGPEGRLVRRVLVEEQLKVERELYLGIVIDNSIGFPLVMASDAGGVDIEDVAAKTPERIQRLPVDPSIGFQPYQGRQLALTLGLRDELMRAAVQTVSGLYRAFVENDCSLAEINPLVVTKDNKVIALDAKVNFDDNATFRHPDIAALRDVDEEDPLEVRAQAEGISNYVKLDGSIGCVVNGAGLAMATMDIIKLEGGEPANFLDIGTVNDASRVVNSFRIIGEDPSVRAVLINIFGGMARVDIIAQGVVDAHRELDVRVPVVVRLAGTNLEEGIRLLQESGLKVDRAEDLGDAAVKIVRAVKEAA